MDFDKNKAPVEEAVKEAMYTFGRNSEGLIIF
jgi:hypothetical protein